MNTHTQTHKGSLFGAILLVSGCCIGAGMLGIPVLSAMAGFEPSVVLFILSWLFMTITGLLLLEVTLLFKEDVNIVSMASRTLGVAGKAVAWFAFLFLFYSLMVAYGAASGELFVDFTKDLTGIVLPNWFGILIMVAIFGAMVYLGTQAADKFNRLLMFGLVGTYVLLVGLGASYVNPEYLQHRNWNAALFMVPVLIVSFGYHNLVPSLTQYLNHDAKRLRLCFIIGSAIPLLVYLTWEYLILGLVPLEGPDGFLATREKGDMATKALRAAVGSPLIVGLAHYFAFFAIVTSFIGVALSFVDFLADGLGVQKGHKGRFQMCLLALVPPFIFAVIYPKIFLDALNIAGGYFAVVLFGILPALMAWSGRYVRKMSTDYRVPGGKILLVAVILISCAVIGIQLTNDLIAVSK